MLKCNLYIHKTFTLKPNFISVLSYTGFLWAASIYIRADWILKNYERKQNMNHIQWVAVTDVICCVFWSKLHLFCLPSAWRESRCTLLSVVLHSTMCLFLETMKHKGCTPPDEMTCLLRGQSSSTLQEKSDSTRDLKTIFSQQQVQWVWRQIFFAVWDEAKQSQPGVVGVVVPALWLNWQLGCRRAPKHCYRSCELAAIINGFGCTRNKVPEQLRDSDTQSQPDISEK